MNLWRRSRRKRRPVSCFLLLILPLAFWTPLPAPRSRWTCEMKSRQPDEEEEEEEEEEEDEMG